MTVPTAKDHNNIGVDFYRRGELVEAIIRFRKAAFIEPGYVDAHSNLGAALNDMGRLDEAEEVLRATIALSVDHAAAHCNLGMVLQKLGRIDEAMEALTIAIDLDPSDATIMSAYIFVQDFTAGLTVEKTVASRRRYNEIFFPAP